MTTDIILDDDGQEKITFAAAVLKTTASDLIMDSPTRHKGKAGLRRALVHDANDGLTLNYNGDYSGGLNLLDAQLRLRIHRQVASKPVLPKRAEIGDLFAIHCLSPASLIADDLGVALAGHGARDDRPVGDLKITRGAVTVGDLTSISASGEDISLWLCVRGGARKTAYWREIPLGNTIKGLG